MQDLKKLAVQQLYDSVYRPMLDSWNDAYGKFVQPYLDLLKNVRDKEKATSDIKTATIKMLGYDFDADFYTEAQLTDLIDILVDYQQKRGSSFFLLLGWVKNIPFQIIPLWTKDYTEFFWDSTNVQSESVVNGGDYWPTNRVDLLYDISDGTVNRGDIIKAFYEVAPIELVLNQVVGTVITSNRRPSGSGGTGSGSVGGDFEDVPEDIKIPNPDDYPLGVDDPDYINDINKLKKRKDCIFIWENHPAYLNQAIVANYVAKSSINRGVSLFAGKNDEFFSNLSTKFTRDVKYLYNGESKGITYSRGRRLVRWIKSKNDITVISPDEFYYSGEGWIYSTKPNTNLFVNSTNPKTQSVQIPAGIWTIWNRGFYGSVILKFENGVEEKISTNSQSTFEFTTSQRAIVEVEPGISFVQIEPVPFRTQGIYSFGNEPGIKDRDLIYTDIQKAYSVFFKFKLIYSDTYIAPAYDWNTAFSFGDFLIKTKVGVNQDRSDSGIRIECKDFIYEGLLSEFEDDGFVSLQLIVSPTSVFLKTKKDKLSFDITASRIWFGSNKGKDNADIFIKQILAIEGEF